MNKTNLGWHFVSAFGIADVKAYLGLQRSDDLNPVYVSIWSTFAECQPESPGLFKHLTTNWPKCFKNIYLLLDIHMKMYCYPFFSSHFVSCVAITTSRLVICFKIESHL